MEASMFKEFKDFAMKGNVIDMAVGIIIGGAFGTIKITGKRYPDAPHRPSHGWD
jgi:hypothetical protein